jgi:Neuraminidase (sialidase)
MKNKTLVFFLLSMLLFSAKIFSVTPVEVITSLAGDDPVLATSSSGQYVYAAWQDNSSSNVFLSSSSDYGQTWSSPIDTTIAGSTPQIVTSSDG